MTVLNIRHRTTYRYREAVRLGPPRRMLRPRESRAVRLLSSTLETTPAASVSWTNDVFGNAVATAGFAGLADGLTIESRAAVELGALPWPVFDIAASAIHYPFFYSSEERTDLGALAVPQTFDASGRLADWARGSATRAARKRAHRRPCRPSIAAGARAATSPCCSPRRRAAWASGRGSSRAISTIRIKRRCRKERGREDRRWGPARPMRGPRSSCRAPAGSPSIRPTGRSVATISFLSPSVASSPR